MSDPDWLPSVQLSLIYLNRLNVNMDTKSGISDTNIYLTYLGDDSEINVLFYGVHLDYCNLWMIKTQYFNQR